MNQMHVACIGLACLLAACGDVGSAGSTGAGAAGTGGGSGQGGNVPDASGSSPDAASDAPIITCEDRDGNACTIPPDTKGCQRCVISCCCELVAACRAEAGCAAGIAAFDACLQKGNKGVACLVDAVEASDGGALFAPLAECLDSECMSLECQL